MTQAISLSSMVVVALTSATVSACGSKLEHCRSTQECASGAICVAQTCQPIPDSGIVEPSDSGVDRPDTDVAPQDAGVAPIVDSGVAPIVDSGVAPSPNDTVVTVMLGGAPAADVDVVFHDSAGAPTRHLRTDANGEARAPGVTGGMVTALRHTAQYFARTVVGVGPGDHVVFGRSLARRQPIEIPLPFLVRLPSDDFQRYGMTVAAEECFTAFTSDLGGFQPQIVPTFGRVCDEVGGRWAVLLTAWSTRGQFLVVSAYSYYEGVTRNSMSAVDLPPLSTQLPTRPVTVEGGAPGEIVSMFLLPMRQDSIFYAPLRSNTTSVAADASGRSQMEIPTIPVATGYQRTITRAVEASGIIGTALTERVENADLEAPVAASRFLPKLGTPSYDGSTLRWSEDLSGTDVVVVRGTGAGLPWSLMMRPGTTEVTWPRMPSDLAGTVTTPPNARIEGLEWEHVADFQQVLRGFDPDNLSWATMDDAALGAARRTSSN